MSYQLLYFPQIYKVRCLKRDRVNSTKFSLAHAICIITLYTNIHFSFPLLIQIGEMTTVLCAITILFPICEINHNKKGKKVLT